MPKLSPTACSASTATTHTAEMSVIFSSKHGFSMPFKHYLTTFASIILLLYGQVSLWAAPNPPAAPKPGCTSLKCHSDRINNANVHPAKLPCQACHKANNTSHPDDKTINFTTTQTACNGCHPEIHDHDYQHPPVAANACLTCHLVHGSKESNYINGQGKLSCYKCHNRVVKEGETHIHGEIAKDRCSSCHTVHGSRYPALLRANYSLDFFNDFTENTYKLCFRCHKIDLLLHPRTSYNTKFRDGKKNLHYIHVNIKSKGRSCSSCHRTHASKLPFLMAESVPFGKWQLPINFKATLTGGTCSPGCHAPESYSRVLGKR